MTKVGIHAILEAISLKLHQLVDKANLIYVRKLVEMVYFRRFVWNDCNCLVYHSERLPDKGPAILVSSHSSHMDAGVIQALYPLKQLPYIRPSAARDHFTKGLAWHLFARGFMQLLFVDRGSGYLAKSGVTDPFAELHAPLQNGLMIIIFPQGTRNPEAPFRSGIVHLAKQHPEVPIIPILLTGTREALPPKATWFKANQIKVYVGQEYKFDPNLTAAENTKALESYISSLDR